MSILGRDERRVGILLDATEAVGILVRRGSKRRLSVLADARTALPEGIWAKDDTDLTAVFRSLAADLGREARRADVKVSVALPDPLVLEELLSFRDLPEAAAAAAELIRWRVAREHRTEQDRIACTSRPAGAGPEGAGVLVRVLPEPRVAALAAATSATGLRLDRVETLGAYLTEEHDAEVRITPELWSVRTPAAGADTPSRIYADWCDSGDTDGTLRRIARVLRSLVLKEAEAGISVRMAADAELGDALEAILAGAGITLNAVPLPDLRTLAGEVARG